MMGKIFIIVLILYGAIPSHGFEDPQPAQGWEYYLKKVGNKFEPVVSRLTGIFNFLSYRSIVKHQGESSPQSKGVPYYAGLPCAHPPVCRKTWYRSIDGSCNNLQRPIWGMALTPYGRLLPYNYADGIHAWPVSKSGAELPNPRAISALLFYDKKQMDSTWNLLTQSWGQVIAHDLSLTTAVTNTDRKEVMCCKKGKLTSDEMTNPVCKSIKVSPHDPNHAPFGTKCMNFLRASTTLDRGCTPSTEPAKQLSEVTAYMDMSPLYGSTLDAGAEMREYKGGRLRTSLRGGQSWLPQSTNVSITCQLNKSPKETCYIAGDVRTNQNPQLAILINILVREHNRIADALAQHNPHWDDETTFQETRRINIAQYQHINYYEYLPILIGNENMVKNKLIYPGVNGYVNDYDSTVDPSVLNEHGSSAFRHYHSLIRGQLHMVSENRQQVGSARLSDWYFRPMLFDNVTIFEDLVRGLTTEEMKLSDQYWTDEVTQYLFRSDSVMGIDLRAIDIQRGRDHGLASYVATREACGLPIPKSFSDMTDFISVKNVRALSRLYASIEDVELTVAGSLEKHVPGALVGPTYQCVQMKQFYRTRVGDRFFYENGKDSQTAFTPEQLNAIRGGATMARLLCDNVDGVRSMQPQAFKQLKEGNRVVPCEQLPAIDLSFWKEAADETS